jgi:hypothetical protein
MKKSLIVHGCWSVAVIAAFAFGSMRAKKESANSGTGPGVGGRTFLVSGDPSGTNGTTGGSGGSGIGTGDSDSGGGLKGWSSSQRPLTDVDITELGRQFKSDFDPIKKRLAFAKLLEGLTVENARFIREQVAHLDGDSAEFREFHYAWGAIGGSEAVMNGAETKQRDMSATLAGWASADPAAAMKWLNEIADDKKFSRNDLKYPFSRNDLKMGMVHGLANSNPSIATDFVFAQAKEGDKRAEQMLGVVTGKILNATEPEDAAQWAENLPPGGLRASAMDRVAHDFVNKDPKAAAAWAEQFVDEEHSARVIEEVGDEWAERDPASSVAWLESLDSSDGKSQGLRSALGEWASKDPKAASQYLVDLPASPERDSAITGFVGRVAWEDPTAAIAWAGEITSAGARESTLIQAGQAYFRRQPEEATAWLPESGLSPEAVNKVLNSERRRRR